MFKEEKLNETIMVVRGSDLFRGHQFTGFLPYHVIDYKTIILDKYGWMTRGFAEEDPNYKQPIAYSMVFNPDTKQVFAFQRSKIDKAYPEKKLQGKWSWGIGGHIEKSDLNSSGQIVGSNPIIGSMLRELHEEVDVDGTIHSSVLGYINDNDNVGKVHFGILYLIKTNAKEIKPKDPEIAEGKLRNINQLEEICASKDVEGWSRIAFNALKNLVNPRQ